MRTFIVHLQGHYKHCGTLSLIYTHTPLNDCLHTQVDLNVHCHDSSRNYNSPQLWINSASDRDLWPMTYDLGLFWRVIHFTFRDCEECLSSEEHHWACLYLNGHGFKTSGLRFFSFFSPSLFILFMISNTTQICTTTKYSKCDWTSRDRPPCNWWV